MVKRTEARKGTPAPDEVKALREALQATMASLTGEAQDICAHSLYTSRRAWMQWEHGDRAMHPAFWELATTKINKLIRKHSKADTSGL